MKKSKLLLLGGLGAGAGFALWWLRRSDFYKDSVRCRFVKELDVHELQRTIEGVLTLPGFWQKFDDLNVQSEDRSFATITLHWQKEHTGDWELARQLAESIEATTDLPCACMPSVEGEAEDAPAFRLGIGYPSES